MTKKTEITGSILTSTDHSPNIRNYAHAIHARVTLEIGHGEVGPCSVPAGENILDLDRAGVQHRGEDLECQIAAIAGDLGGVVDEILGDVGVFRFLNLLLEVEEVAEDGDCLELLPLASVGLGALWTYGKFRD